MRFKLASQVASSAFLNPFISGELVSAISGLAGYEKLNEETDHALLKCPRCGGNDGFKIVDCNFGKIWNCKDPNCKPKEPEIKEKEPDPVFPKWEPEIWHMSQYEIPQLYWEANIEDCKNEVSKDFFKEWAKEPKGFVLLTGSSGRGKTYAACAAMDVYRKNFKKAGKFVNFSYLYLKWKDYIVDKRSELEIIRDFDHNNFLILDDVGIRTPSDAFLDFIYVLINERIEKNQATIVTTNLNSKQMSEKLGDALTSRLCSGKIIKFEGKDQRILPEF